jgi:hypothetical protein
MSHLDSLLCAGGCGFNETIRRLYSECDLFSSLWWAIENWLGVSDVFSIDVQYHALQFGSNYLFNKETLKSFMAIWVAYCWIILKKQSFSQYGVLMKLIFDKVKTRVL